MEWISGKLIHFILKNKVINAFVNKKLSQSANKKVSQF